jgi:hypothetical protein
MTTPVIPPVLPMPIATGGDTRTIPEETPAGTNQLSFQSGFPAITSSPLAVGGIPAQREDFNAALKLLSQHVFFQQSGGVYLWSDKLNYLPGNIVRGPDGILYEALQPSGPDAGGAQPTSNALFWLDFLGSLLLPPKVPASRAVNTTPPLTGGGNLSADRTLGINPASQTAAGSMSAADKIKLDGIEAGATLGMRVWTSDEYTPVPEVVTSVNHQIPNFNPDKAIAEAWLKVVTNVDSWQLNDMIRNFGMSPTIDGTYKTIVPVAPLLTQTTIQIGTLDAWFINTNRSSGWNRSYDWSYFRYVFKIFY